MWNKKVVWGNIWLHYIRDKRKILVLLTVFALVLGAVYQLYDLSWEPFFYGLVLCLAAGILAMIPDGYAYWRRHRQMLQLKAQVRQGMPELPAPQNLQEEDDVQLLRAVWEEKENCLADGCRRQQETLDYYTLWAHQVKTPIAAMGLLLQGQDTEMGRALQAELFKTEQYVEMALSYVRLGSSSTDYVFRRYSLDDLVRQAVRKYASLFIQKKLKLDLRILSNALKYTNQGCISIYQEPEKVLVIADTGIGIIPEDLPRIWEKGFTGYNGRTDKRATGIGMYLCRRVLENLSHAVTVESQVGKGTKVSIVLDEKT